MKTRFTKKMLSFLLAALMVVTMLPTFAISASAATCSSLESLTFTKQKGEATFKTGESANDNVIGNSTYKGVYYNSLLYVADLTSANEVKYTFDAKNSRDGYIYTSPMYVVLDDGSSDMKLPVMLSMPKTFTWSGTHYCQLTSVYPTTGADAQNDNADIHLNGNWAGGDGVNNLDWRYAINGENSNKTYIGYSSSTSSTSINVGNKGVFSGEKRYYYSNIIVVDRPTTGYQVKTISNTYWRVKGIWDKNNNAVDLGTVNPNSTIYVVNYKPIADAIDVAKTEYNNYKNSSVHYTSASITAYQNAARALANFDINSYDFTNVDSINQAGADIATIAANFNNNKPVPAETTIKDAVDATCGANGYTGDTYCTDCNAKIATGTTIPATGIHTWGDPVRTTEPTCGATGVDTYTCTVCHDTKTEDVSATGAHTYEISGNKLVCSVCGAEKENIDLSTYNAAVDAANEKIADTDKYDADAIQALQNLLNEKAGAILTAENQDAVDDIVAAIQTATENLATAALTVTFMYGEDGEGTTVIDHVEYNYGDVVEMAVPESAGSVSKWVVEEADADINYASDVQKVYYVVKDNAVVKAHVIQKEAQAEKATVTILNKANKVAGYLYVTAGDSLSIVDSTVSYDGTSVELKDTAYYTITGFKANGVDVANGYVVTSDVTLTPAYEAVDAITITIAKDKSNGVAIQFADQTGTSKAANWDEKITVKTTDGSVATWYAAGNAVATGSTYTFRAVKSMKITARSVALAEGNSTIIYSNFDGETMKARVISSSFSSDDLVIKEQGLLIATTTDDTKVEFDEDDMASARKFKATSTTDTGDQFSFTLTVSSTSQVKAFGVQSYVEYTNGTIAYSEITPIFVEA